MTLHELAQCLGAIGSLQPGNAGELVDQGRGLRVGGYATDRCCLAVCVHGEKLGGDVCGRARMQKEPTLEPGSYTGASWIMNDDAIVPDLKQINVVVDGSQDDPLSAG